MNELELINQPIELALAGRKLHFKKLPFLRRHAMAQAWYLSQLVSEAQDKARAAYSEDEGMRRAYIAAAMDKMPAGQDLQDKLIELRLPPALAMQYIKTAMAEEMTMEELDRTILDASIEEYESVLRYVLNEKKKLMRASADWNKLYPILLERTQGHNISELAEMTEEQLAALVPEMVVKVNQPKTDCSDYELIARATAEWKTAYAHLGRAPRYYEDIFPIVERMMKEKAIA